MVKCKKYKDQLILYLFNEIDEADKEQFISHLNECESCRKEMNQLKSSLEFYSENKQIPPPELELVPAPKPGKFALFDWLKNKHQSWFHRFAFAALILLIVSITALFTERKPDYEYWSLENSWEGSYEQIIKEMKQQIETIENDEFFE